MLSLIPLLRHDQQVGLAQYTCAVAPAGRQFQQCAHVLGPAGVCRRRRLDFGRQSAVNRGHALIAQRQRHRQVLQQDEAGCSRKAGNRPSPV